MVKSQDITEMTLAPNEIQEQKIRWLLNEILDGVPLRAIGRAMDVSATSIERYKKGTRIPTGIVLERMLQAICWVENTIREQKFEESTGEAAIRIKRNIQVELLKFLQNIGPQIQSIRGGANLPKEVIDEYRQKLTNSYVRKLLKAIDNNNEIEISNVMKMALDQYTVFLINSFASELTNICLLKQDYSQKRLEETLEEFTKIYRELATSYTAEWLAEMDKRLEKEMDHE